MERKQRRVQRPPEPRDRLQPGIVGGRGQSIGTVGNTSAPGNNISPHLHYEVRLGSPGYPGNIQRAVFNGSTFGYLAANVTSRNCSTSYDPAQGTARVPRKTDSGNYGYYAGPVTATAPTCVKWGGATGGASYNGPSEHC